jgi:hypothetical protein
MRPPGRVSADARREGQQAPRWLIEGQGTAQVPREDKGRPSDRLTATSLGATSLGDTALSTASASASAVSPFDFTAEACAASGDGAEFAGDGNGERAVFGGGAEPTAGGPTAAGRTASGRADGPVGDGRAAAEDAVAGLVATIGRAAAELATAAVPDRPGECAGQVEELVVARDRLSAAIAARLAKVHAAGEAREGGHASTASWLRSTCGMTAAQASREVRQAGELDRLAQVRARYAAGELAGGMVAVICAATARLSDEQAHLAEPILLQLADRATPAQVAVAGRYLHAVLDRDGCESDAEVDQAGRFLLVRSTATGGVEGEFRLPREAGARLRALLDAYAKPRARGDERPLRVRNADAFIALLERQVSTELLVLVNAASLPDDPTPTPTPGPAPHPAPDPGRTATSLPGDPTAAVPDAAVPDAAVPDAAVPGTAVPDPAASDPAAVRGAAVPEAAVPAAGGDMGEGLPVPSGPASVASTARTVAPGSPAPGLAAAKAAATGHPPPRPGGAERPTRAPATPGPATRAPATPGATPGSTTSGPTDAGPTVAQSSGTELTGAQSGGAGPIRDAQTTTLPGARAGGAESSGVESARVESAGVEWAASPSAGSPKVGAEPAGAPAAGVESVDEERWARVVRGLPGLLLPTGQLLAVADVHRLARTSTLIRLVLDADGQVVDMGRKVRLATPAQRRAVLARYASCWHDGCPIPAHLCQIDHLDNWSQGGPTDLKRLGPACQFHNRHRYRHPELYRRRRTGPDRWAFTYLGTRPGQPPRDPPL